jgi:hypothetical protein
MAIEYKWKVSGTGCMPNNNGGVTLVINWHCMGTEGDSFSFPYGGTAVCELDANTTYESLTEDAVLDLLWNTISKTEVEDKVTSDVNNMNTLVR